MIETAALRREIERFDAELPIERAWTPPSSWYVAPAFYELDRSAVLWRSWQPVVRVAQLAEPGDYASGCFSGMVWVVVRGEDGVLRGFHNVCAHKGREVVTGAGRVEDGRLVCGYHAWAYRLDGRLASAPQMAGIEAFDRERMGLRPLGVEVWGPWVFVNGDADAAALHPRVAELDGALERSGWSELSFVERVEWDVACNWKVFVDNYLDGGYHVPHMHPTLAAQIDMASYRTEIFGDYSVQTSAPQSAGAAADGALEVDPRERIGEGAIYAWIYPCLMINRYGPCLDSNHVVPLGPNRCKVIYEFYFAETEGDETRRFIGQSIAQSAVTQREDIEICESVQRGLESPAYDRGRYAPRLEQGEHHFHRLLAASYRAWSDCG